MNYPLSFTLPTYTGQYEIVEVVPKKQGYIKLLTSGTLNMDFKDLNIDICAVAGGKNGFPPVLSPYNGETTIAGAKGGDGGKVVNTFGVENFNTATVSIGAGGGDTSLLSSGSTVNIISSGVQGLGGIAGGFPKPQYATDGQDGIPPFGNMSELGFLGAGGGAGGIDFPHIPKRNYADASFGGKRGGGTGGYIQDIQAGGSAVWSHGLPGMPNTGSGGGGAGFWNTGTPKSTQGAGGSGIVIIRWGY